MSIGCPKEKRDLHSELRSKGGKEIERKIDGNYGVCSERKKFGLCKDCEHFAFAKSEFSVKFAFCTALELSRKIIALDASYPVTECNLYQKIDAGPTLWDMTQIATIIEPRNEVGFL